MPDKFLVLLAVNDSIVEAAIADILTSRFPHASFIKRDNGASALLDLNQENVDIAILQLDLPVLSGLEVREKCNEKCKDKVKFVLLSQTLNIQYFQKAKELGFLAYLDSSDIANELEPCLNSVIKDSCFISRSMSDLLQKFGVLSKKLASLSPREILFLNEVKEGKNYKEISDKLVLSSKSISQITSSISKKLEISSKDQAIKDWAKKNESIFN